jgi:hypothetical protein
LRPNEAGWHHRVMRLDLLTLPLLALPLACSFASQGEPEASGDELANTGSETATDGQEVGTEQGSTSEESTGDGDGDPTSTTDDTTTTTTDDTTTDTDTDTDTDTTTESTTDTTDTTETETTESETTTETETGMEETYYADCPIGVEDCAMGEVCKLDADPNDEWQVCALPCDVPLDCPEANGLPLLCITYTLQPKGCHINCENTQCPDGMSCKEVNNGTDHICAYDA